MQLNASNLINTYFADWDTLTFVDFVVTLKLLRRRTYRIYCCECAGRKESPVSLVSRFVFVFIHLIEVSATILTCSTIQYLAAFDIYCTRSSLLTGIFEA